MKSEIEMSNERETNVEEFIGELNAGMLRDKIAIALSNAAMAQVNHGIGSKVAKVSLEFTLRQMGDNDQVVVSAKMSTSTPTKRGKKTEEDITDTAFFVGKGGQLTINPPKEEESGQFSLQSENDGVEASSTQNIRRIQ